MAKERKRQTRRDQKGRILRKGEGQNKDGRYYYVYTDASGKRRRIYGADLVELREAEQVIKKILLMVLIPVLLTGLLTNSLNYI